MSRVENFMKQPIPAYGLAVFRILLGILLSINLYGYIQMGLVEHGIMAPKLMLTYDGFEFIKPYSTGFMNGILYVALGSAILITLGLFTRVAAVFYFITHTYLLFIDAFIFNNHIYLFSLLGFWLIFVDSDKVLSLRRLIFKTDKADIFIPTWHVAILAAHFFIAYFYGGLTKFNSEWLLRQEPMRSALLAKAHMWPILKNEAVVYFFTYGGLIVDLALGFLLIFKRTRWIGVTIVLLFNLTNAIIFRDIDIFPFVMITSLVLFFNQWTVAKWFKITPPAEVISNVHFDLKPAMKIFIYSYLVFQLLFPLRFIVLPNPVDWSGIANKFSWRMKVQARNLEECYFVVEDAKSDIKYNVNPGQFLHTEQVGMLGKDARLPVKVARYLAKESKKFNVKEPIVRAFIKLSYNGHPSQYYLNTDYDLTKVQYSAFKKLEYLMPLGK